MEKSIKDKKSSASEIAVIVKPNNKAQLVLNTREVRYPVIKRVAKQLYGFKLSKCRNPEDDWDVLWTDQVFSAEKLQGMKSY